ncbi:MAG: ABC transporter permease [Eubacteriales bacterium]|nr:ABC transporter permease [Eubacteriales bacterium]
MLKRFLKNSYSSIVLALLFGFVSGAIILAIAGYSPAEAYGIMFKTVLSKPKYIAQIIVNAAPIILTGLAVAFAYNTGLFNIGAEGQYVAGTIVAAMLGHYLPLPAVIHPIFILIVAFIAGGLLGALAAWLKNRFGIHEVISTIMLNWIIFYINNFLANHPKIKVPGSVHSPEIRPSASLLFVSKEFLRSDSGRELIKAKPVLGQIIRTPLSWGIPLAIVLGIVYWFILKKTRLGYTMRAVGLNKDAAEFSGIPVKKNVFSSMFFAGGAAGLAGAIVVLSYGLYISTLGAQEGYGWDGISVSLIARANPIACIFSGILFAFLRFGGQMIQSRIQAPTEIINIMIGSIVLAIAVSGLLPRLADYLERREKSNV